jgi:hypothetical protein
MSSDALDIYRDHLDEQLGVNAPATEEAVIDPSGTLETHIYGVFDDNTFRNGQDTANQYPKREGARFTISQIPASMTNFDVYANINIYLPYRDKTFIIQYIETDKQGAQVIWLT